MSHMLIIGGGLAGGTAAEALREEGYDGDITVVAAEPHPPYQRPPLSKGYLAGKEALDAVILHPAEWYAERDIRLITGVAATRLDPAAHTVELDDGTTAELRRGAAGDRRDRRARFRSPGTSCPAS